MKRKLALRKTDTLEPFDLRDKFPAGASAWSAELVATTYADLDVFANDAARWLTRA